MSACNDQSLRRRAGRATAWFVLCLWLLISCPAQADVSRQDVLRAASKQAVAKGLWSEAEASLRELLNTGDASAETHSTLGYVLFREQKPTESLAEYTAAARLRTPNAEELMVVASDYILLKDYPDAKRWLLDAVEESPGNANAWYLLGRTQYNLDLASDAADSFARCLRLRPKDVRAEYNLGLAYERMQQPQKAEEAYRAAIEWQREAPVRDPQPYLDLGMLLLSRHLAQPALSLLQEAVVLGPGNPLAHQELGLAMEALGRDEEAVASLKRASELAPNAERPHYFLGRIYRRLGRTKDAVAQFAEVSRLTGSHSETPTPNR